MKRWRLWDDDDIRAEGDFTVDFLHEAGHVVAAWCLDIGLDRVERHPHGQAEVAMSTHLKPDLRVVLKTQPQAGLLFCAAGGAASQTLISQGLGATFADGAAEADARIWVKHAPTVSDDQVKSGEALARFEEAVESLAGWVIAHESQINLVAQLFWEEFIDDSKPSPRNVAEVLRAGALQRDVMTARLVAEGCPEPSCTLKGVAGRMGGTRRGRPHATPPIVDAL